MKRLFLCLILTAFLFGCSTQQIQKPAAFYYPTADFVHVQNGSLLDFEVRETVHQINTASVLELYMNGPENARFHNPFPSGCKVIALRHYGQTLDLVISDELSQLTGISLPLACASLAKTCMELTGAQIIRIRAEHGLLGGNKEIIFTPDTLNISSSAYFAAGQNDS